MSVLVLPPAFLGGRGGGGGGQGQHCLHFDGVMSDNSNDLF